jgi:uncharacterized membrane protein
MKKGNIIFLQTLVSFLPVFLFLFFIDNMPDSVPVHFNINSEPDRFGSKYNLLATLAGISFICAGVCALILNLNKIDPKKKYAENNPLIIKITWTVVIFLSIINSIVTIKTAFPELNIIASKFKDICLTLLIASFGNLMNSLKQNYFVGIRTPWALEDEENWRKTHQLTSKIWFWSGIIMTVLVIAFPIKLSGYVIIISIIPLAVIPMGYSYLLFKRKEKVIAK